MHNMPNKYDESYGEVYIKLSKNRVIFLNEIFTKEVSSALCALLMYYDHKSQDEDILIYINSNGGDGDSLINIIDCINMIKAPVSTIAYGKAYSAGALLLASGAKGKRIAFKNSSIMVHGLQTTFPRVPSAGQEESEVYYKFLEFYNNCLLKILSKDTKKSFEQIKKDLENDLWMTPKEALEYGIIDMIIE